MLTPKNYVDISGEFDSLASDRTMHYIRWTHMTRLLQCQIKLRFTLNLDRSEVVPKPVDSKYLRHDTSAIGVQPTNAMFCTSVETLLYSSIQR